MTERRLRLGIIALDGCMLSGIASPGDALHIAQTLAGIRERQDPPRFETVVFNAEGRTGVTTSGNVRVECLPAPPDDLDMVLVPGIMHASASDLVSRMRERVPEIQALQALHGDGVPIAAACAGTVLLAHTGLLDGRRATTSWWLTASFRHHFPKVDLQADAMVVDDGSLMTSGAASAVYDIVLRMIARTGGEELAQQTARILLVDSARQSQAPYVDMALVERPRHSLTERAEGFLRRAIDQELSVAALARHCGTSERTLLRRFREQFGSTPQAHIQHLRVERAKALLETTHLTLDEIVGRCGYSDVSSFRKLFKRATSVSPAVYRDRFRLRPH